VNVIWGLVNFLIGYVLIFGVGEFAFGLTRAALMVGIGALIAAVFLSLYFERIRGR
jgi:Na+-driven multidrug efflux pump